MFLGPGNRAFFAISPCFRCFVEPVLGFITTQREAQTKTPRLILVFATTILKMF
jgi:hypothetical protein